MKEGEAEHIWIWTGQSLDPVDETGISPRNGGFLFGLGVFETLRIYRGIPFAWDRHLQRLRAGAECLDLSCPDGEALIRAVRAEISNAEVFPRDGRLRITVTGGERPACVIGLAPLPRGPRSLDVACRPFVRNERGLLTGVKSTSYAENLMALAWAKKEGCHEALWATTRGELCEGSTANVFLVRGGTIFTPPLGSGCLPGVTRELLLECAREGGRPVKEERIPMADLDACEGMFLSSSLKEIVPVRRLGERLLEEEPAPLRWLRDAFRNARDRALARGGVTFG